MDNKNVFATNLKRYMERDGKSRKEMSKALGISYYTVSDWVNGKKYPRMDKVEMLANYFGVLKSDLIEDKSNDKTKKNNDTIANIIVRLRVDEDFFSLVEMLNGMNVEKIVAIKQTLEAFNNQSQN